jgi:UDP-N-acetylmuramyl pentapeptide phosphotransferase/UDP-N-acetylglucosamine-1-phosphate transferase
VIIYLLVAIVLLVLMLSYMKWAEKAGIIDQPNVRSSHTRPTIRGGGVIFPVAVLLWGLFFDHGAWPLISAVVLAGLVGFLDDRYSLHQLPRIVVQSFAVVLLIWQVGILAESVIMILLAFFVLTGWLNAFNFMDGINGISSFYSLVLLFGVWLFADRVPDLDVSLIYVICISLIIFSWFNARKRALVFAGDVGSMSLAVILGYLVALLMFTTGRWEFIVLISVYGVDTVMTIFHRLIKKENIFKAHRSHLYQYLANEMKWEHITISVLYGGSQFGIILGLYFINHVYWSLYSLLILSSLGIVYLISKSIILKK